MSAQGFDPYRAADEIMGGSLTRDLPVTDDEIARDDEIWQAWIDLAHAAQREDQREELLLD